MKIKWSLCFICFMLSLGQLLANEKQLVIDSTPNQNIINSTEIIIEAEDGLIQGQMHVQTDGRAFNNRYLEGYHVNRRGWTTYEFEITEEGSYVIWGRVLGWDQYSNSFYVKMDNDDQFIWDINKQNRWEYDRISDRGTDENFWDPAILVDPVVFHLTPGTHYLHIGNRERHTRLDRLIITNKLAAHYNASPTQQIHLVSPAFADILNPGSNVEVKWTSQNISGQVNIDLSFDRGETFTTNIVTNTPNDGSYTWTVPSYLKRKKMVLRVSDASGGPFDVNYGYFSIINPAEVYIDLRKPNGGEVMRAGDIYVIEWVDYCFNGLVTIFLSLDNGATWQPIKNHQDASGRNWWNIPDTPSTTCLLRAQDAADGQPFDISDAPFTILAAGAVSPKKELLTKSESDFESGAVPFELNLFQNYPNPFNPTTTIRYSLAKEDYVQLKIMDILGKEIQTLVNEYQQPGLYSYQWNAENMASGIYFYTLQTQGQVIHKKMSLVH